MIYGKITKIGIHENMVNPEKVSFEGIARKAYQDCLKSCDAFEMGYLTDLIVQKIDQRWWSDTYNNHVEGLA